MPTIEIPEETRCARCGEKPITVAHRGHLYCGDNCLLHDAAELNIQGLARMAKEGRCGSPLGLKLLADICQQIERMEPVRPDDQCPQCWGPLQPQQAVKDGGESYMVERCMLCNWSRATKD